MSGSIPAILAALVCGILSGFGIGGGSLLMIWLTAVLSFEQRDAQGINLLYFLPTALASLLFHVKHKRVVFRAAIPAAIAGCLVAGGAALLAGCIPTRILRRLFGIFLLFVGLNELFFRKKRR